MRKLDRRGVAAFEFCLVAIPFLTSMFVIFDLGRYAITVQSLRALANAGARTIMINCYTDAAIQKTSPTGCGGDLLPSIEAKNEVPLFLYYGHLTPTLSAAADASPIVVTASQPDFIMAMTPLTKLLWPASFDKPSVSTQIPFPASSS